MHNFLVGCLLVLCGCSDPTNGMPPAPDMAVFVFPMGCTSGAKDGDETDVDCGGSCMPCGSGQGCGGGKDCKSGVCANKQCLPAACNDGIKNGDETDIDCGGSCQNKCAEGQRCADGVDCQSTMCVNNACTPSLCANGKKDGMETDVDCGGPLCMKCGDGKICSDGPDCVSGMCINNVCKSPLMCVAPMANCDGNPMSGCNVNLNTDAKNCGKCGSGCPMNTPVCTNGTCSAMTKRVLIVTDNAITSYASDIQAKLQGTGAFSKVDVAPNAKPTLADLLPYDAVLVYTNNSLPDPTGLGNTLATYFDNGGQVVTALDACFGGFNVGGRFATDYMFIQTGGATQPVDSIGQIVEMNSPLVAGVKTFGAQQAFRCSGAIINGGIVVAKWGTGDPLIIRGQINGRKRADLNFFPPSSAARGDYWTGDGAALLRNALLYR